jgi:hypothetical protein
VDREDEPYGKILAYSIYTCFSLLLASFGVLESIPRWLLLGSAEAMKFSLRHVLWEDTLILINKYPLAFQFLLLHTGMEQLDVAYVLTHSH